MHVIGNADQIIPPLRSEQVSLSLTLSPNPPFPCLQCVCLSL